MQYLRCGAISTAILALTLAGCGGPSDRELENRKSLEMLLTAITLRNPKELEKDATRIDERHTSGQLSDSSHRDLREIIGKARAGDWAVAEELAYKFRETQPYFK